MRAFARARVKPNKRYACCLGVGRTQGLYTGQGVLAVAVAMSLCVAVPNAPYVPKVIALKPMLNRFRLYTAKSEPKRTKVGQNRSPIASDRSNLMESIGSSPICTGTVGPRTFLPAERFGAKHTPPPSCETTQRWQPSVTRHYGRVPSA